jgi:protein-disulfide isomerase
MAFADILELDMDQFKECYESQKYRSLVQQDLTDGFSDGVNSTPSFLINGKLVVGAQPYAVFQQEIQAALAASEN